MSTILVHGDRSYPVIVEAGARRYLTDFLDAADRVAIIHPAALRDTAAALKAQVARAITIEIPDAEAAKNADVLSFCWTALGRSGFTRNDVVVSLGGGATTDLAGFVAATWLRGIRVVHVPTTLLAMVDAAVGGKTGINTSEGKNLVGAFHCPTAVLADLDFLETLPRRDYVAGLAEVVKAGFIRDDRILHLVESDPSGATRPQWTHAPEIISRAIQVKADVVALDMREQMGTAAGREILNYGHTFGHAVERVEDYRWRHGDAVAVGMVFAAELARLAGRMSLDLTMRHRHLLRALGLPTTYHPDRWGLLSDAMRLDKKARGSMLRFIILTDVAQPTILTDPDPALLFAAYECVSKA